MQVSRNMDQIGARPTETLEFSIDWIQSSNFEKINKVF